MHECRTGDDEAINTYETFAISSANLRGSKRQFIETVDIPLEHQLHFISLHT